MSGEVTQFVTLAGLQCDLKGSANRLFGSREVIKTLPAPSGDGCPGLGRHERLGRRFLDEFGEETRLAR